MKNMRLKLGCFIKIEDTNVFSTQCIRSETKCSYHNTADTFNFQAHFVCPEISDENGSICHGPKINAASIPIDRQPNDLSIHDKFKHTQRYSKMLYVSILYL